MKRLNKEYAGFSPVEIILILVIIGVVGFAGWFVWNAKKNTEKTQNDTAKSQSDPSKATKKTEEKAATKDETASWRLFTATAKTYSLRLPDGWHFRHDPDTDTLLTDTAADGVNKAGIAAVVDDGVIGDDVTHPFLLAYETAETRDWTDYTKTGVFEANGITGTKYYKEYTEDNEFGIGPSKGSKEYDYYFEKDGHAVVAMHIIPTGAADLRTTIEKSLKTLQVLK